MLSYFSFCNFKWGNFNSFDKILIGKWWLRIVKHHHSAEPKEFGLVWEDTWRKWLLTPVLLRGKVPKVQRQVAKSMIEVGHY